MEASFFAALTSRLRACHAFGRINAVIGVVCLILPLSGCQPNLVAPAPVVAAHQQPLAGLASAGDPGMDGLSRVLQASHGNDLKFRRVSVDQGLSKSIVWDVLQDRQGFLWFATEDGLNRYDGVGFKIYKHDPENQRSLSSNNITALIEDQGGVLWVGTNGGGITRFDPRTENYRVFRFQLTTPGALSSDAISTIYQDQQGIVWVGTNGGGLNRYDSATSKFSYYAREPGNPDSLSSNYIAAVLRDSSGLVWVGTDRGLDILNLQTGKCRHVEKNPANPFSVSGEKITALAQSADGSIWVGSTDGGLDRYDPVSRRFTRYPAHSLVEQGATAEVTALLVSKTGLIWVGTQSEGLALVDPSRDDFRYYQSSSYDRLTIGSNQVEALYEDRTGILWIGTFGGGISMLDWRSNQFTHLRRRPEDPNSLSGDIIWSVLKDSSGFLWVGTHKAGLNRLDRSSGKVAHFRYQPDRSYTISSDTVRALYEDPQGYLWIGTDYGLNRLNRADLRIKSFLPDSQGEGSLGGEVVVTIAEDPQRRMWVALSNGIIDRFDPQAQSFVHYRLAGAGEVDVQVLTMLVDSAGVVWVGTMTGLVRLDPGTGQRVFYSADSTSPNSLSNNQVLSLFIDRAGRLWVGTRGGLNLFDPQQGVLQRYRERDGLPNDYVAAILEDRQGALWLSTDLGLSRFDPQTGAFKNFDVLDGLQSNEFNAGASFRSNDGEMFFGGINGLTVFSPDQLFQNTYPPPVFVTSLTQGGAPIPMDKGQVNRVVLEWPRNYFEFQLSALNYSQPSRSQFAYFLEGFDKEWVELGSQRTGRYTNLPGGTYTLHVRGSNNDSIWNENASALLLTITPPIWEAVWFQVSLAIGFLLAVITGLRWRFYRIQQRSRELEVLVEKRTEEIERRRQVAEGLREVILRLNMNQPLQESLEYIACQVSTLLQAYLVCLFQSNSDGQVKLLSACRYDQAYVEAVPTKRIPDRLLQALARQMYLAQEPVVVSSGDLAVGLNPADQALLDGHTRVVIYPILLDTAVCGGVAALLGSNSNVTPDVQDLLETFCEQAALAIGNNRLRAQAEELAVVSERNRLARDLHDAVTQTLFSASLIAETLPALWKENPQEGCDLLQELRQLTRGALAEMRTLLMELRPTVMVDAKLSDLLRQLAEAVTGKKGIVVQFNTVEITPLPVDVHICLYRIAQEALANVVKHSRAQHISINLFEQPILSSESCRRVVLEICDDGRGFDKEHVPPDHFGLVNMRERAQAAGAQVEVITNPGRGTVVRAVWIGKDGQA